MPPQLVPMLPGVEDFDWCLLIAIWPVYLVGPDDDYDPDAYEILVCGGTTEGFELLVERGGKLDGILEEIKRGFTRKRKEERQKYITAGAHYLQQYLVRFQAQKLEEKLKRDDDDWHYSSEPSREMGKGLYDGIHEVARRSR